jgi:very-short-patch-repair endonuclease
MALRRTTLPQEARSGSTPGKGSPRGSAGRVRRSSVLESLLAWQVHAMGLPEPVRELVFAPPRRWRLDFAWPEAWVAVEVDGGTWTGGRHVRGAGIEADCEKVSEAAVLGWRVLRVTGDMVRSGRAVMLVGRALA